MGYILYPDRSKVSANSSKKSITFHIHDNECPRRLATDTLFCCYLRDPLIIVLNFVASIVDIRCLFAKGKQMESEVDKFIFPGIVAPICGVFVEVLCWQQKSKLTSS